MDVLVHLSRREGLARVLPQAMAAGIPVVASDCDGAPEACIDGQTGFLIPPDAPDLLVDRLALLARDPALGKSMAQRGRRMAQEEFPVQRMVDSLESLYLGWLRAKGIEGDCTEGRS
jgi:glycosyltransferase involved in cell wall biosynthesis